MDVFKSVFRKSASVYHRLQYYFSVNWIKTIYFNFKKFPFSVAVKLPVFFFGQMTFQSLKGTVIIDAPIKKGMISFGKRFEKFSRSKGIAELSIDGTITFKGYALFGKDCLIAVEENSHLEIGHRSGMGNSGKLICTEQITLGNNVRISFESQIMDSHFHQMVDTLTGEKSALSAPIQIGNNNFLGNRVSILPGTMTPDFCTVASNSVCNKDYRNLGENILIGGVTSKLLKAHISRDWQEAEADHKWLF